MPIDAMLLGGRRATTIPLVHEAFDWEHGVFLGATMSSETTAAAAGKVGQLRFDPFAMLPFCGYNMADYFEHWLEIGRRGDASKLPRIFYVNWFRKDAEGRFLWPGFGENSRVLEWVFRRCAGDADAHETPIGLVPTPGDLYTGGLDIAAEDLDEVLAVDRDALREQLPQLKEHLAQFGDRPARRAPGPARRARAAPRHRLGAGAGAQRRRRFGRGIPEVQAAPTAAGYAVALCATGTPVCHGMTAPNCTSSP